jgi:hypothetical protein
MVRTGIARVIRLFVICSSLFALSFVGPGTRPAAAQEGARAEPSPTVQFVSEDAAGEAIVQAVDATRLKQMAHWQLEAEVGAALEGDGDANVRQQYKQKLSKYTGAFTGGEKKAIRALLESMHGPIAAKYPKFAALAWSFIKVSNDVADGLPHTRGKHIILSSVAAAAMKRAHERGEPMATRFGKRVLLHEQVHVFQRANRELFTPLYTEVWPFKRVERIEWPKNTDYAPVSNPDTVHKAWLYPIESGEGTRWILPRLVTRAPGKDMNWRGGMSTVGFDVVLQDGVTCIQTDADGKVQATPLRQIPAYRRAFPATTSNYHPTELAADYLAFLMIRDCLGRDQFKPETESVMKQIRPWARKAFSE